MDQIHLKCAISGRNDGGLYADQACLVLRGDLTRETVRDLAYRLESVGAKPRTIDAQDIRFADAAGLAELAAWSRRAAAGCVHIVNAPRPLGELASRYHFERFFDVTTNNREAANSWPVRSPNAEIAA